MVDNKLRVESCNQLATYTSVTDAYSLCLLNYSRKQWNLISPHYYYCYLYWYLWWNVRQGQLTEFFDLSITNTKCTKGKQLKYNLLGSYPMWDVTNHTIENYHQFYKQDLLVYKVYPSLKSSHDFLLFWNCFIWLFSCWHEFGSENGFWPQCEMWLLKLHFSQLSKAIISCFLLHGSCYYGLYFRPTVAPMNFSVSNADHNNIPVQQKKDHVLIPSYWHCTTHQMLILSFFVPLSGAWDTIKSKILTISRDSCHMFGHNIVPVIPIVNIYFHLPL